VVFNTWISRSESARGAFGLRWRVPFPIRFYAIFPVIAEEDFMRRKATQRVLFSLLALALISGLSACRRPMSKVQMFANGRWDEDAMSPERVEQARQAIASRLDGCEVDPKVVPMIARAFAKVPSKVRDYLLSNQSFRIRCQMDPAKYDERGQPLQIHAGDCALDPNALVVRLKGTVWQEPSVGEVLLHEFGHASQVFHQQQGAPGADPNSPYSKDGNGTPFLVSWPASAANFVSIADGLKGNTGVSDYARGYAKTTSSDGRPMVASFFYWEMYAEAFLGYYYSSQSRKKMCELSGEMCQYIEGLGMGAPYWDPNNTSSIATGFGAGGGGGREIAMNPSPNQYQTPMPRPIQPPAQNQNGGTDGYRPPQEPMALYCSELMERGGQPMPGYNCRPDPTEREFTPTTYKSDVAPVISGVAGLAAIFLMAGAMGGR
jgi:hypothetical protein